MNAHCYNQIMPITLQLLIFATVSLAGMVKPKAALGSKATAILASTHQQPGVAPLPHNIHSHELRSSVTPAHLSVVTLFAVGFLEIANPRVALDSKAAMVVLIKSTQQ